MRPLARPYCAFGIIVVIAAEYAGKWNAAKVPAIAPAMYQCQIWRFPVTKRGSMATVVRPWARSLRIIVSLRFHRSTRAPAIGLNKTVGAKYARDAIASVVACPVIKNAQITRENPVIPLPRREKTWPTRTNENVRISLGPVRPEVVGGFTRPRPPRGPAAIYLGHALGGAR